MEGLFSTLKDDNQGALVWSRDGLRHLKHVAVRMNFVKEQAGLGNVISIYSSTEDMPADILAKPPPRVAFGKHRDGLDVKQVSQCILHDGRAGINIWVVSQYIIRSCPVSSLIRY